MRRLIPSEDYWLIVFLAYHFGLLSLLILLMRVLSTHKKKEIFHNGTPLFGART
jgi:hypothetical protein